MRIQYVKQGGDGRIVEMEQGAAKRLIASGQAVEVGADQRPTATTGTARAATAKAPRAAKKTAAKKTAKRAAAKKAATAPAAGETGT